MPNRLAEATSPYLQQHAHNPVDWRQWSPQAFDEARDRDVPVLLSVGYAACHWCHVMAHESFEDPAVGALVNERFVAIKVDREERPDVDAVYMRATQLLTGSGGWPMTVFLDHDGRPFHAGTYYPPDDRHGMPSFTRVLRTLSDAWATDRDRVLSVAAQVADALRAADEAGAAEPLLVADPAVVAQLRRPFVAGEGVTDWALGELEAEFDPAHGGFGGAPKFPPSSVLEFLLRHHARTGAAAALTIAESTCEAMARGGLYDQLGGGFARYSVDAAWVVPHFEKMLYDNAQLARVYLHLWRSTGSALGRRVALQTAEFLVADLRTPLGGFASSLDADSEPIMPGQPREGAYYVWTPQQLHDVLGPTGSQAARWLGVDDISSYEYGTSVLQLREDPADAEEWLRIRQQLARARGRRPAPGRDDKVVTAWNGLAVAALAETGLLLEQPHLLASAAACADLLLAEHLVDGRLRRASRDGIPGAAAGVLEDYAGLSEGLLALYQATGEVRWLRQAGALLATARRDFGDGAGGFFDTSREAEPLLTRPRDPADNATASGWTQLTGALLTYAALTGDDEAREAAQASMSALLAHPTARRPRFFGWGLAVLEAALAGPLEVAVIGEPGGTLHRIAMASPSPGLVVAVGTGADDAAEYPALLAQRSAVGGPTAFVCRQFACELPTTDPAALAQRLGSRIQR